VFNIVVYGALAQGVTPEFARTEAARLFRLPPERLETLFSGQRVIVKRNVDQVAAERYRDAVAAIGLVPHIEPSSIGNVAGIPKSENMPSGKSDQNTIQRKPGLDGSSDVRGESNSLPDLSAARSETASDVGLKCASCGTMSPFNISAKFCAVCGSSLAYPLTDKSDNNKVLGDTSSPEPVQSALTESEPVKNVEVTANVPTATSSSGNSISISKTATAIALTLGILGNYYPFAGYIALVVSSICAIQMAYLHVQLMKAEERVDANARVVVDILEALQQGGFALILTMFIGFILGAITHMPFAIPALLTCLASGYIGKVFAASYVGIIIDEANDVLSIQGSELENGFMDILTFKALRNTMTRERLQLSSVEGVFCETKRWTTKTKDSNNRSKTIHHVKFCLNMTGIFGSRHFEFSSKQKRDEARSAILTSTKNVTASPISDVAVDLG